MNVQDEIKELKQRIAELEEQVKEEQEFPQDGDGYWYIDDYGYILNEKWDGLDFEEFRLEIGNMFKTKEQAEFAVEKLKVEAELRKYSRGFEVNKANYLIVCDTRIGELDTLFMDRYDVQGAIYFESKEKGQQAIEEVGEERVKKYIFGVEDL